MKTKNEIVTIKVSKSDYNHTTRKITKKAEEDAKSQVAVEGHTIIGARFIGWQKPNMLKVSITREYHKSKQRQYAN
ncbi:hypothetical protein KAR91_32480 [Candidatus Pacearchaeota archaeon]|nr:hypothetical protein [Candidatus Pacearchaeota archaeon]